MANFRTGPLYVPGPGRTGIANPVVGEQDPDPNSGYNYGWAQPYPAGGQQQATQAPASSGISFLPSAYQSRTTSGTTTSTMTPTAPGISMPTFTMPKWQEGRVRELRRTAMAPVRQVRQGLRRTLASLPSVSNIAVAREMGRGAVEGLGSSISQISEMAGRQALGEYRAERGEEISGLMANFNAAMMDYMARFGRTSTSTSRQTSGFGTGSSSGTSSGTTRASLLMPQQRGSWGQRYWASTH